MTPKYTCLNGIMAPRSRLLGLVIMMMIVVAMIIMIRKLAQKLKELLHTFNDDYLCI